MLLKLTAMLTVHYFKRKWSRITTKRGESCLDDFYNFVKRSKGQKCNKCKKEIKKEFVYNGKWWCSGCKEKDTKNLIKRYIKDH